VNGKDDRCQEAESLNPKDDETGIDDVSRACGEFARAALSFRLADLSRIPGWDPHAVHVGGPEFLDFAQADGPSPPANGPDTMATARGELDRALEAARASGAPHHLDRLCRAMDLDSLHRDALAILLAMDRSPSLRQLALSCVADPVHAGPTPLFVAELAAAGDWEATRRVLASFGPEGAFVHNALVTVGDDLRRNTSLDPSVAAFLSGRGLAVLKEVHRLPPPADEVAGFLPEESLASVRRALALAARRSSGAFRLSLVGPDGEAIRRIAAVLTAEAGQRSSVTTASAVAGRQGRFILRDARLRGDLLLVEEAECLLEGENRLRDPVAGHPGPVAFVSRTETAGLHLLCDGLVEVQVPGPTSEEAERIMGDLLGGTEAATTAAHEVAARFGLTFNVMEAACAEAISRSGGEPVSASMLADSVRSQMRTRLGEFADLVTVGQGLEDLVLPPESKSRLDEMVTSWRHRERVLEEWGFGARVSHSRGMTCLFYGPPGTGKTMAAGIVSRELGLEVVRVDLSRVVDKYIGETEKHLSRVFEEAERGQVMLLFDEADSLFGKRTSGGTSVDRYANMEVNYLLQRMERYEGVVVLTTNNERLLDEAFKRRLRYRVHFPLPTSKERERIWRGLLPPEAQVSGDLDWGQLSRQYEMSGGHIRNAMLRAAYLSADRDTGLTMKSLKQAADIEYRELGRLVREEEEAQENR